MKASDYIISFLEEKGIHDIFGYQGTMIAHFVDSAARNPRIRSHSCYNEQGAAFAACGYAQSEKTCACAYATSGPGAVNLLSGVADAYFDSLPVIFITGQLNTYEYINIPGIRQHGFQEIDIAAMAKPITKYAVHIRDASIIPAEIHKAYDIANSGRKGPVLLDIPMDIQRAEIDPAVYAAADIPQKEDVSDADALKAAEEILNELKKSSRPAVLIGNGLSLEGRRTLTGIAEKYRLPVITSILAKDALPYDHELNFGCIGAAYGTRTANMIANAKSDLLICFGISLCTRQIGTKVHEFAKDAKIIRVDIDTSNLRRNIHEGGVNELRYNADAAAVAENLEMLLSDDGAQTCRTFEGWLEKCGYIRSELKNIDDRTPGRETNKLVEELSADLESCAAVAFDVGQSMVWGYYSFKNISGQSLMYSGGHGAMGYALPAAIGAYYALKKPVACLAGDGGFQMNIQELQWLRKENIPVKVIIFNNHALGMIRQLQEAYFDSLYIGTVEDGGFSSPSFADIAGSYGIPSMSVEGAVLTDEASAFLKQDGPLLLEFRLEQDTAAYPKTCLGEPIHNQQPYMPKELYEKLLSM